MRHRLSQTQGVAGDGVTDDRAAVQALFDALPDGALVALDVPALLIGPGGLKPPRPVTIDGAGCVIIWRPDPDRAFDRLLTITAHGWTHLTGLRVQGPGGVSGQQHAVIISGADATSEAWVSMTGCVITDTPGDGTLVHDYAYLQARRCEWRRCGRVGLGFSGLWHKADIHDCEGDSLSQEAEEGSRLHLDGGRFGSVQTRTHKAGSMVHASRVTSDTGWMHQGPGQAVLRWCSMGNGGEAPNGMAGALHTVAPGDLTVMRSSLRGSVRVTWGQGYGDGRAQRVAFDGCHHALTTPVPSSRFYPRAHLSMSQGAAVDRVVLKEHTWLYDTEEYPLVGAYGASVEGTGLDPLRLEVRIL